VIPDGTYETVAGFMIERLGRIPDVGDTVRVGDVLLRVSEMVGPRITGVSVLPEQGET
jgi:putative hemolysin